MHKNTSIWVPSKICTKVTGRFSLKRPLSVRFSWKKKYFDFKIFRFKSEKVSCAKLFFKNIGFTTLLVVVILNYTAKKLRLWQISSSPLNSAYRNRLNSFFWYHLRAYELLCQFSQFKMNSVEKTIQEFAKVLSTQLSCQKLCKKVTRYIKTER